MAKITSAMCVAEIIKVCQDPRVVMSGYCGGSLIDYDNDVAVQRAMQQIYILPVWNKVCKSADEYRKLLVKITSAKTHWKRLSKERHYFDPSCIVRIFECVPFEGQLRATVLEKNGAIIAVAVAGE
jgi:hypothetical protein